MSAFELEDSEMPAERIDCFTVCRFDVLDVFDIRERTGHSPASEGWLDMADIKLFLLWGGCLRFHGDALL